MSLIREQFVKIIETMPYDINEEIFKKNTEEILKDVVQKYKDTYGTDGLSENDKECIKVILGEKISVKEEQ